MRFSFYVWDKTSEICGVDSDYMLSIKPEYLYDDVLVIEDVDTGIVYHFETRRSLMKKYDIHEVNEVMQVGLAVIKKLNDGYPLKGNGLVEDISDSDLFFLFAVCYDMRLDGSEDFIEEIYAVSDSPYAIKVPECKITSSEIEDDEPWDDKSVTVILENVCFPQYTLEDILKTTIMKHYKAKVDALEEELKITTKQEDKELSSKIMDQLTDTFEELINPDGVKLTILATKVYEYDNLMIIKTRDEQTVFVNKDIVKNCKHNVLEYEKRRGSNETYPVHYETIYVTLEKDTEPEVREFGDSVYITY